MSAQPLVSVCLPARNAGPFIEETLESVRAPTYQNWELIIVENCSTDDTLAKVQGWMAKHNDARVRFHKNESLLSMAENWNRTLDFVRGEFVKVVCADDLMAPGCLEAQANALAKHPEVAVVACGRQIINAQGKPLFQRKGFPESNRWPGPATVRKAILSGANIIGDPVAVLMRATALAKAGKFNPQIVYYTDLEMWLRVMGHGDFEFIAEPLSLYRIHSQATQTSLRQKMHADYFRVVDVVEKLKLVTLTPRERWILSWRVRLMNGLRNAIYRWMGG